MDKERLNKKNRVDLGLVENLEKEHIKYLKEKGLEKYQNMTKKQQKELDDKFPKWWAKEEPFSMFILGQLSPPGIKKFYLAQMLLSWKEFDFIEWSKNKGYKIYVQNKFNLFNILYYGESLDEIQLNSNALNRDFEEFDEELELKSIH